MDLLKEIKKLVKKQNGQKKKMIALRLNSNHIKHH